ncbi:Reticulon-domain-containing protein [Umbelopsis sp. AD052]|nr:Reticulon-domain-containing protein [Umbelopsis sp. AD052]
MEEQPAFTHPDLRPEPQTVSQNFPEPIQPSSHVAPLAPLVSEHRVEDAYTHEPAPTADTFKPIVPPVSSTNGLTSTPIPSKVELPSVVQKDEPSLSKQIQRDLKPVEAEPPVTFEQDPTQYVQSRFWNLVMWQNPAKSAIYLAASLLGLIITQHYSLLQIFAALATIAIGVNWVFVNAHVQGQKLFASNTDEINTTTANPHRSRLNTRAQPLSRQRVTRLSNTLVDVSEILATEGVKIVLIDDNKRSLKYLCGFYVLWTVAKYLPSRWIIGLSVALVFSVPKLYYRHQDLVDARINQATGILNEKAQVARSMAEKHASTAYQQISTRINGAVQSPKKVQ